MYNHKSYYIYTLIDPCTNNIRYVGITYNPEKRLKEHIKSNEKCHKTYWIKSLINNNKYPKLKIIDCVNTLEEAFSLEKTYIKDFKHFGVDLTNVTEGGTSPMSGRKHSEETKRKMSESRIGEKNSFYGKKHSKETIEKLSILASGRSSWSKGKKFTEQHKQKLRKPKSVPPYNKGKTRFDLILMEKMINNGHSQSYIAKYFNTDQGTISRYKKKYNFNIIK